MTTYWWEPFKTMEVVKSRESELLCYELGMKRPQNSQICHKRYLSTYNLHLSRKGTNLMQDNSMCPFVMLCKHASCLCVRLQVWSRHGIIAYEHTFHSSNLNFVEYYAFQILYISSRDHSVVQLKSYKVNKP
jgi:hypothetical protein